ncbi:MAG: DNA mismatch repair protein MutS [Oscillospiraceae bacterium]|nr:DNA mismatch repair protein MutS [Oscillospiraceae bacterium]
MAELTPMMKQYFEIKNQYPDTLLFYRLGDFYELFFDDAKTASRELELVLTGRDCGQEERAPMCGVPFHAADTYIARLVSRGYKVAICEQTEDPAAAKGIVKRDVIRVVTPGTVTDSLMLDESKNNYLACVFCRDDGVGLGVCDISTSEVNVSQFTGSGCYSKCVDALARFSPSEMLMNSASVDCPQIKDYINRNSSLVASVMGDREFDFQKNAATVENHFKKSLSALGIEKNQLAVCALGTMLGYLYQNEKNSLENITELKIYSADKCLSLSAETRQNLELTETYRRREKKGSLLWVLDKTKTAMGKRKLRSWINQPLIDVSAITYRQNAVEELYADPVLLDRIFDELSGINDLERISTRIVYGNADPKEMTALAGALRAVPRLKNLLCGVKSNMLKKLASDIDPNEELASMIEAAIKTDAPRTVREGGIIKTGYNEELDSLREIVEGGVNFIKNIELQEQERTGIKKLKIGYNKVFGYYIEVLNTQKELVPENYIRKQTLTNCERYITPELKELEGKVLGARERIAKLEYDLFCEIRSFAALKQESLKITGDRISALDVICSLAKTASENSYSRPVVDNSDVIIIKDGRHPVVEKFLGGMPFVPNDVLLDSRENRTLIITGPNMAGKSTYMRQTALITLMAQMGSFVPASSATIGIVDSIFTRIGAADDLAAGQSTFMTEMSEVASILSSASSKSLIILDEIGRGTSTFDGMSIARAVLEYVNDKKKLGARTMFATHYHEITEIENELQGIKNYNTSVKKRGDDINFLRRIVRGRADGSYGIEVAKLAGIPGSIVKRARVILNELESGENAASPGAAGLLSANVSDEGFFGGLFENNNAAVLEELKNLDLNTFTPIEALTKLYELKNKIV